METRPVRELLQYGAKHSWPQYNKIMLRLLRQSRLPTEYISQLIGHVETSQEHPGVTSGKQIRTLLHSANREGNIDVVTRLLRLLVTTCGLYHAQEKVYSLLLHQKNVDDAQFYSDIRKLWLSRPSDAKRMKKDLGEYIGGLLRQFIVGRPTYMDYGVGNGKKARAIARYLRVSEYYGADIPTVWMGMSDKNRSYKFLPIGNNQRVDLPDSSLDLITCIHVLHHIRDVDNTILEMKRLLRKKGFLVIVEHDCITPEDRLLIDIEHALYERVFKENYKEFFKQYYGKYQAWFELQPLIERHDFVRVHHSMLRLDPVQEECMPTRSYVSIFKRS